MTWIADVLRFWFSELTPKDWFAVNAAVDETIRIRFAELYCEMRGPRRPTPPLWTRKATSPP